MLKALVLDTLGCAIAAGSLCEGCARVAGLVRSNPGIPEATLLGYGERASVQQAAFLNGAHAHGLNFDALGAAGGHLGIAAVVAPLCMAERTGGVGGRDFLAAVAVAAEFTARLADALHAVGVDANEKFLEGQLLSYLGATAGAGRILGLTAAQMQSALGLALMQTAGTRQVSFEGGEAKAIYGGFANQAAVLSALLAEQGIDARCDVLEGRAGIFQMFYGGKYDSGRLRLDGFLALDTVFKRWPTSGILHPYIEACLALRGEAISIDSVRVTVMPEAVPWMEPAEERRRPRNAATAANSLFFTMAKALVNGSIGLGDFTSEGLEQPEALALAARIDCAVGEPAMVEVKLRGGQRVQSPVRAASRNMDYELVAAKFRDCVQYAVLPLDPDVVEMVVEQVANLDRASDVSILPRLFIGGKRAKQKGAK